MNINSKIVRDFSFVKLMLAGSLLFSTTLAYATPKLAITQLPQLIKIATQNNASLKSKKRAWQSLIQQYPQAIALNDPRISYSEALRPVEKHVKSRRVLTINQRFPYPGKLELKGKIVWSEIKTAKVRYDKASRDLVVNLKQSFHELVYLENAIQLSLKNKKLLETINKISSTDYAANASTLNDVAKAQSQYAQVSYDVQLLQELQSVEKTRINTLLNRPPEQLFRINATVRKPTKFPHSLKKIYQWAEANEELQIADLAIEKSAVKKELSGYVELPDFDIELRYTQVTKSGENELESNNRDGFALNISINVPINFEKNNAIKEQARLNQLKQIEDKKGVQHSLRNSIKGIYFKLNNSYRLITLYGDNLIPQANRAMQVAQLQYRENKGSVAKYLETQSTWLNFQLAYQRAIADYAKNHAEMERLTGRTL